MTDKRVIPFPQLKERLLKKLDIAIAEQNHDEIIYICNELLKYHNVDEDVLISKINALIALKQWDEAENFCEWLMKDSEEAESLLIDYYMFILHEAWQYVDLIETFESSLAKGIISQDDDVLVGLYESAKQELQLDNKQQIDFLMRAFNERNSIRQIQIISILKRQYYTNLSSLYPFLVDSKVHPVVKTELLLWATDLNDCHEVTLEKFGQKLTIRLDELNNVEEKEYYQKVLHSFNHLQQENPTQYKWLKSLLYHYYFVIYPFSISKEEIKDLIKALQYLSEYNFDLSDEMAHLHSQVKKYIKEIQTCHELYLQIYSND